MARSDGSTTDYGDGWRAGAEAMREAIAGHLGRLGPAVAGMTIRFNATGWHATVMDVLHYPIPAPPPQPDGLSYRGG